MYNEPSEEAFGLSKEGLRAGEEERWRGGPGGSRTIFFSNCMFFNVFSCASKVEVGSYFHFQSFE